MLRTPFGDVLFFVLFLVTGFGSRDLRIYRIFDIETGFDSKDFGI